MVACAMDIITRDNIQTSAHVALVIVLLLNLWNFKLQRDSLQVSLFSQITHGLRNLLEEIPSEQDAPANILWRKRLVWEYDAFAFFANHKYLKQDVIEHFRPALIEDCRRMMKDYPEVFETIPAQFATDLRQLFRNATGEDLPHAPDTRTE